VKGIIDKIMHTWWLRHLLFWFAIWNYGALGIGMTGKPFTLENLSASYMNSLPYQPGYWLVTYPLIYGFIPGLLVKRKYLLFTLAYLALIFLVGGVYANKANLAVTTTNAFRGFKLTNGSNLLPFFNVSGIATAIKFIKKAYTEELMAAKSEEQKTLAELELLKAQIHPHFLFNTLNNLFAHTLRHTDDAPRIVVKLSDLLRFMIYDSRHDLIPLEEEIQLIRNYIDLEGLRYGTEMDCQLNIDGNPDGYFVRPLLLVPLIENAFKHGMSQQTGDKWIRMQMKILPEKLEVTIANSYLPVQKPANAQSPVGGVGLENVRKRLQLLYPGSHEFRHESLSDEYHVLLRLPLEKNIKSQTSELRKEGKQVHADFYSKVG
jgi:sensor histidine kinase YesM